MKDCKYILSKVFKKQTIPLFLLTVLMVLFFASLFNGPVVYASEQIASVKCDVLCVEGENQKLIATDSQIISDLDVSEINFSDIDVKLNARSKLEFVYLIENITNENRSFKLELKDYNISNFKIEYFIDGDFVGELTTLSHVLLAGENVQIKVVAYVDKITCDASLSGALELTFESVGV